MERVIKFRAWDKSLKKFKYPELWDSSMSSNWKDWYELQQFTGLLDKNGKEIYEGDIVTLVEAKRKYTVEYVEYSFKLVHADPKMNRMHWGSIVRVNELDFTIEVIGNVFENPDLLQ